jgi:hypothetical protein
MGVWLRANDLRYKNGSTLVIGPTQTEVGKEDDGTSGTGLLSGEAGANNLASNDERATMDPKITDKSKVDKHTTKESNNGGHGGGRKRGDVSTTVTSMEKSMGEPLEKISANCMDHSDNDFNTNTSDRGRGFRNQ